MKRPRSAQPRRPRQMSGLSARTAKEAAIHLVRLEFDRNRVERGILEAEGRAANLRRDREHLERQRASLLALMTR